LSIKRSASTKRFDTDGLMLTDRPERRPPQRLKRHTQFADAPLTLRNLKTKE